MLKYAGIGFNMMDYGWNMLEWAVIYWNRLEYAGIGWNSLKLAGIV